MSVSIPGAGARQPSAAGWPQRLRRNQLGLLPRREDIVLLCLLRTGLILTCAAALSVAAAAQTTGSRPVGPPPLPTPHACVAGDPLVILDNRTKLYSLDGNPPGTGPGPQPMWSPTSWSEIAPPAADADAPASTQRVCKSEADAMGGHLTQGVRPFTAPSARPRPTPAVIKPRPIVPPPGRP